MSSFRLDFVSLGRRYRRARGHLRLRWAMASICAVCAILGAGQALGAPPPGPLAWLSALAAAIGLPFALDRLRRFRPGPEAMAAELDRRFELGDLLVTALEVDRRTPHRPIEAALLDDAARRAGQLASGALLGDAPRRARSLTASLALLAAGLWLLALARPTDRVLPLPALQALGPMGQGGEGPGAGHAQGLAAGSAAAGAAGDLARTLADHGAGRDIADALARGDPALAAAAARRLADRSAQLSPAGRRDLGKALRQASSLIPAEQGALREALEAAATALEGRPSAADWRSLERMAEQLARLADAPSQAAPLVVRELAAGGGSPLASGSSPGSAYGPETGASAALPAPGVPAPEAELAAGGPLILPAATVMPSVDQADFGTGFWGDSGSWAVSP